MIAPGAIQGSLLDSQGRPAPNVRVEVLRLNAQGNPISYAEKKAITDHDGRYRFKELPQGSFQVGVNLFESPDAEVPYGPTKWSAGADSSIHLNPGEQRSISPFRLPRKLVLRRVETVVRWPDGRPAEGATLWAELETGQRPPAT
jgi:hypothetical protein